ncbi:hypothetical protein PM082_016523 [Marasmius tenuissimus]|nr:hypothetical protein PM082_016523 [Marasmius tenuissimus]
MTAEDQGWTSGGGHGTYHNGKTWFEASILRPTPVSSGPCSSQPLDVRSCGHKLAFPIPAAASSHFLQHGLRFVTKNDGTSIVWKVHDCKTAHGLAEYVRTWLIGEKLDLSEEVEGVGCGEGDGDGFVGTLQPGDRIVLWGRAQCVGWIINFEKASIAINYDLFAPGKTNELDSDTQPHVRGDFPKPVSTHDELEEIPSIEDHGRTFSQVLSTTTNCHPLSTFLDDEEETILWAPQMKTTPRKPRFPLVEEPELPAVEGGSNTSTVEEWKQDGRRVTGRFPFVEESEDD